MRYLVFADIHANLAAFQAVLAAAGRVDGYIFLGDVVSYGPEPQACVELLQALAPFAVAGNHDRMILDLARKLPRDGRLGNWDEWTARELDAKALDYLARLPDSLELDLAGQSVLLLHDVKELNSQSGIVLSGHTHQQACERKKQRLLVNPGSVSQQRDGSPLARYAIWDGKDFSFARASYPVEETVTALGQVGLNPHSLAEWTKNYRLGSYNPQAGQNLADS